MPRVYANAKYSSTARAFALLGGSRGEVQAHGLQEAEESPPGVPDLERLAQLHSRRRLDVRPELYELWLDRLIQAVREFDPLFSGETEKAWRNVMRPGVEFMKARY